MARDDLDIQLSERGAHDEQSQTTDDADTNGISNESEAAQAGVRRIEAVSRTWTTASLIIAYVTLFLMANVTSLELQVTSLMTPYATSAFQQHSLVSTVTVIQGVVSAVIKPPMGKIADVFGRLESFAITIFLYTIGYIQQAASENVKTFASAQIFWAAGFNGLQILQQIFVADTTDLSNRALFSTLFDVPFLWMLAPSADGKWSNGSMISMLVVGIVILIAFPFWETSKRLAPKAFFPPNLFRNKTIIAGTLIAFLYFMAFYMSVFPYFYSYLLIVQNKSITTAGNITRVFSLSSTVSSIIVSLIIKYTGHYKYYVTVGSCIYLLGMGIMLRYRNEDASTATLVGTQIAIGIGGGILNVPVQLGVQASASHQQVAAATTVWLTLLEVGGAVGSAISGAIWSTYVPRKLQQYLPAETVANATIIFGDITTSSDYITYPPGSPTRIAINRAYQETMRLLLIGALFAAAPIVPLTFFLQNYRLREMEQPVEGRVIGSANGRRESDSGFLRRWFRR
ncbi:uncharacterized protein N0V89_009186 [Didymosphaeria variabile]|uniref:MFS general substrate transporter n=1 Tax=Didymosphaeria variabile TaxID=1932322 RepID=A0A9W9C718_9PLEO|nr:uncharacterized protein N0V89_009186 [Didymosphaeria variabile]KAJ4347816.1 hypothetical protein N0V89_009186 [Didymosphaeria variabile]